MSAARTFRTPLWLGGLFIVLLGVFAVTPDPTSGDLDAAEPTSEPTPGARECVVCPIDQQCDPDSGQCMFVDHTPWPCVKSAKMDEQAGFCLPEGAPPAPAAVSTTRPGRIPGPDFPPGIRDPDSPDEPQGQDLPGFGD
jgi:hypothetical protein